MRFSTYFIIISYLMVGAGFVAGILTETINTTFLIAIGGIIIVNLFLTIKGKILDISKVLWNIIAVIILVVSIMDYIFISQSLIEVSARFLTILMVVKLFDLKTNRDYTILYILTFFQLLSASASTVNLSFLFVLALYILTGIWALTIFTLKKDWEEKSVPHRELEKNILTPYFFLTTTGIAILSLIITLSLFFIIPRIGVGFFPKKTADVLKVSGFSEEIDLGELGPIKLDPTIVMRVELPGHKGMAIPNLYFRGISFDSYDGSRWLQTIKETIPLKRDRNGIFNIPAGSAMGKMAYTNEQLLKQVILLEPIDTNVIFAASYGIGVSDNLQNIIADATGSFYLPAPSYSRLEYSAYSVVPSPPQKIHIELNKSEDAKLKYLALSIDSGKLKTLAEEIVSGKKGPLDKAVAIEEYLKKNYGYTLNPRKGDGINPIEDFLFYTKEGYCEQYATAMAIMLRTVGIPSRLVTGFLPGEWNRFGNYLIIRQRDAHSWVEAYIKGSYWVMFDPTPSAEAAGIMPAPTSFLNLYLDSLRWRWNRYIINYSFTDQMRLMKTIETRSFALLSILKQKSSKQVIGKEGKRTAFIIAVILISSGLFIFVFKQIQKLSVTNRWPLAPQFYKDMLKLLAKKGKGKKESDTPFEFANTIVIPEVNTVTWFYYNTRFGNHALTSDEREKIADCLKNIKSKKV